MIFFEIKTLLDKKKDSRCFCMIWKEKLEDIRADKMQICYKAGIMCFLGKYNYKFIF